MRRGQAHFINSANDPRWRLARSFSLLLLRPPVVLGVNVLAYRVHT